MEHAQYGRMKVGGCIRKIYGEVRVELICTFYMITCFHEVVLDNFFTGLHILCTPPNHRGPLNSFPAHNVICYVILIWVSFTQSIQKSCIPRTKDGDRWGNIMLHCCPLGGQIGIAISVPMTHDSINAVHIKMSCCKQKYGQFETEKVRKNILLLIYLIFSNNRSYDHRIKLAFGLCIGQ